MGILLKTTFMAALAAMLFGCKTSTVTPYACGYASGHAAYLGYCRIADKKSPEFKAKVAEIWDKVNAISNPDTLATDIASVVSQFDKVLNSDKLSDSEKQSLSDLRSLLLSRVDKIAAAKASEHEDALEYLRGARDGINACIKREVQQ